MQINRGIAYFGDESMQGTLKDKIQNAIDSDVTSIQIKNSDIKSFEDFSGYTGSIACYLDDIAWNNEYFKNLNVRIQQLKELGLNFLIIPTMMSVDEYKAMGHDEKLNTFRDMSKYIMNIFSSDINIGLLNTENGIFIGNVILPIINNLSPDISDRVGYAVNVSEKSDGGISKLDFKSVSSVNIEPVVDSDGNLIYDRSRSFIGNVYYEFAKFGHMPSIYTVANDVSLPTVNNMASLVNDVVNIVSNNISSSERRNGMIKTKVAPGYHQAGVSSNAGVVENHKSRNNFGFVDCMQLFLVLSTLCLIGVMIAVILVLL